MGDGLQLYMGNLQITTIKLSCLGIRDNETLIYFLEVLKDSGVFRLYRMAVRYTGGEEPNGVLQKMNITIGGVS